MAAAAALLVVAGCGSSDGGGSIAADTPAATPPAVTLPADAPRFVKAASAICTATNDRVTALGQPATVEDSIAYLDRLVVVRRDGEAKLKRVHAPAAQAAEYGRFVALLREQTDAFLQLRAALSARDSKAVTAAGAASDAASSERNKIAIKLRIAGCS